MKDPNTGKFVEIQAKCDILRTKDVIEMIEFEKLDVSKKQEYDRYLRSCGKRGCEYSFANLFMWGRQQAAVVDGYLAIFSQFERRSVYPFPAGNGDLKVVLDAIIHDAGKRGIVCRLTGLTAEECVTLEELYPGKFNFHPDRNGCDYVYRIEDLSQLKGRKYQKKRNHVNRFRENHPNCKVLPITSENLEAVKEMTARWYDARLTPEDRDSYHLEQRALCRAFQNMEALELEGIVLEEDGKILAMTMGSRLREDTFDIHFEKALDEVDGAYPAINQAFAAWLWEKYPQLQYLNREDDMGLPGLRKAKLSYYPDHLVAKFWARLWEETDED